MGKKWKKKQRAQEKAFDEYVTSAHQDQEPQGDVFSRLGRKKANKKDKKKSKFHLNKSKLNLIDVDMSMADVKKKGSSETIHRSGWHRVSMPNCSKYPKDVILQILTNALSLKSIALEPICFQMQGPHYSFYVESPTAAAAIKSLDKQLTVSPMDPFVLTLRVSPSPAPSMVMNTEAKEILKVVMSNRYNTVSNQLNLNRFHNDPAFIGHGVYLPLSRSQVMSNVIEIINSNIPNVAAIDFSQNRLPTLDYFTTLTTPNLKSINFDENRLELKQLEKVKHLKLVEISLQANPAIRCIDSELEAKQKTIDAIRKILPSLQILNGTALPKKVSFGEEDEDCPEKILPTSIKKLATEDFHANELVLQFLREFYNLYDSDNRGALLQAYHSEALFSLSSAYPRGTAAHGAVKLQDYQTESRNLKLVTKNSSRQKLLKQGHLSAVALMSELPASSHDLNTFTLDIPFAIPTLITFTITGLFRERRSGPVEEHPIRYFNRQFVLLRSGSALTILNDMLFVTMATQDQIKSLKSPEVLSAVPQTQMPTQENLNRIAALSQATRMNLEWSKKCLEGTSWNYDLALSTFKEAFSQSQVPQEAFTAM